MARFVFLLLGAIAAYSSFASVLPVAPEIGTASPGNGSATVSFTPSALGSGREVEYMVVCNNNVQSGVGSPITVTGLTNGTAYGCRVRVTTSIGTSPWSELSNVITPGTGVAKVTGVGHSVIWLASILVMTAVAYFAVQRYRMPHIANSASRISTTQRVSNVLMLAVLSVLWIPGTIAVGIHVSGKKITDPSAPLVGVVEEKSSESTSIQSILDGQFQKEFATSIIGRVPFYASISRLFNQAQYALLRTSSNHNILVGRDGYLLNAEYTAIYCKRGIGPAESAMLEWAKMISEIQGGFQSRGQKFLFVLTPSKIEYMPDKLPIGYPCPSQDRDKFIAKAIKYLNLAGVNYIDTGSRIGEVQQRYGYEPFPKGGIHWTDLAAHESTNRIIEKLNTISGRKIAASYEVETSDAAVASPGDQDLANLMNLKWPPSPNKTAKMVRRFAALTNCLPPTSIIAIGGSFFTALGRNLVSGSCPLSVRQLFYLVVDQRRYYDADNGPIIDMEELDFNLLRTAEVVILEENAVNLMNAAHTLALHQYITMGISPSTLLHKKP